MSKLTVCVLGLVSGLFLPACSSVSGGAAEAPVEAYGLTGRPLRRPVATGGRLKALELDLEAAKAHWDHTPSESSAIWVGRRLGYLGRYQDAIAWYLEALERWPESSRLRRHLGHRYLSVRMLDRAVKTLTEAARLAEGKPNRIEADGAPNAEGTPRSSMRGNIDYHLALAHYCKGEFDEAAALWRRCVTEWAMTDDSKVAALHWLYTSLVRAGRRTEARAALDLVGARPDVIENTAYLELIRIYRSGSAAEFEAERPQSGAAFDYGLACWHIANGRSDQGSAILIELAGAASWPSFGCLAAEADLSRMRASH